MKNNWKGLTFYTALFYLISLSSGLTDFNTTNLKELFATEVGREYPSCTNFEQLSKSDQSWCTDRAVIFLDTKLNNLYKNVFQKLRTKQTVSKQGHFFSLTSEPAGPELQIRLKNAQRRWIKFRDGLCTVKTENGQEYISNMCVLESIALSIRYLESIEKTDSSSSGLQMASRLIDDYLSATRLSDVNLPTVTSRQQPNATRSNFNQFALLIALEKYDHLPNLQTPIDDVREVANLLEKNFGFKTSFLLNPNRSEITGRLNQIVKNLSTHDDLLIYFAGHGVEIGGDGYWIPKDGHPDDDTNWISNDYIIKKLKNIKATNILVISDSCFSGTLSRGLDLPEEEVKPKAPRHGIDTLRNTKSRLLIASGNMEPILDSGGGGHSIFARALIETLSKTYQTSTATEIYSSLSKVVVEDSQELGYQQVPIIAPLNRAGHIGPDFLFYPN